MPKLLIDFKDPLAATAWHPIDDRVMGGVSRSRLRHDPQGHAVFEGELSLERNGGFASVRSQAGERGLPHAQACLVEVRGGGHPTHQPGLIGAVARNVLNFNPCLPTACLRP
jgi:hypothetical protein